MKPTSLGEDLSKASTTQIRSKHVMNGFKSRGISEIQQKKGKVEISNMDRIQDETSPIFPLENGGTLRMEDP